MNKTDDEDKKEDRVELGVKKEYIVYKDVINNYWEAQSYHPLNNFDEFITKKKAIRNAMLLLPTDIKEPLIKKKVDSLINDGLTALKKQPPAIKSKVNFIDIGQEGRKFVQEIIGENDENWSCPLEGNSIKQAMDKFTEEQYKECLEDLIEAEFKISKFLVLYDIIKKEDKSPDEIIEDFIKIKFKDKIKEIEKIKEKMNKQDKKDKHAK